jgi:hypothetical protein
MSDAIQDGIQSPGEISIDELVLVSSKGSIPLNDYLVELNIFESIFNNVLSGDVLLSDSRNLIKTLEIKGEELLIVKVHTPGLDSVINKTFRVTSVEDRSIIRDQNTQLYKLKFISQEALVDTLTPLYLPFKGNIEDIIKKIFKDNLEIPRTLYYDADNGVKQNQTPTELISFGQTENLVKFVSPGWTPLECINWLSKKALPKSGKACNFLFWETNGAFYFGSVEKLFEAGKSIGKYNYAATSVSRGTDSVEEKMSLIQSVNILNGLDHLASLDNGYFASKIISVDYIKKKRDIKEYDHVTEFPNYKHVAGSTNPQPMFSPQNVVRNLNSHIRVYPKHPGIHTGVQDNYNEKMGDIYGNRLSNMLDLNTLKLDITIYGRTDIEAGRIMEINFPDISPTSEEDITSEHLDNKYSGNYLITSIHHKINIVKHMMTMEVIRDSLTPEQSDAPSDAEQGYNRT